MEAFSIRLSGLDPESRISVWIPALHHTRYRARFRGNDIVEIMLALCNV